MMNKKVFQMNCREQNPVAVCLSEVIKTLKFNVKICENTK